MHFGIRPLQDGVKIIIPQISKVFLTPQYKRKLVEASLPTVSLYILPTRSKVSKQYLSMTVYCICMCGKAICALRLNHS